MSLFFTEFICWMLIVDVNVQRWFILDIKTPLLRLHKPVVILDLCIWLIALTKLPDRLQHGNAVDLRDLVRDHIVVAVDAVDQHLYS